MTAQYRVFTVAVFLTVALTPSTTVAEDPEWEEPERATATVHGEVLVNEYDDDGSAVSVWIQDDELGDVLIDPSGPGRELLAHVGREVQATGRLLPADEAPGFDHVLYVESFTIDPDDQYYDDPDEDSSVDG